VDINRIIGDIQRGKYEFDTRGLPLANTAKLSSVWEQPWPSDSDDHPQLHVYITLTAPADMGSPLVDTIGEYFIRLFAPTQNIRRTRCLKVNRLDIPTSYNLTRNFSLK
jgi:hypothetical protein